MKSVCVFFLCCLAMVLALTGVEQDELIGKYISECRKELNIEESAPASLNNSNLYGCMMFCVQKKHGFMNQDGTLKLEEIRAYLRREEPQRMEVLERILAHCQKTVVPVDGCKMAACVSPERPPSRDQGDE